MLIFYFDVTYTIDAIVTTSVIHKEWRLRLLYFRRAKVFNFRRTPTLGGDGGISSY
jgi:hypothetical protein